MSSDGKMNAHDVATLMKEFNAQLIIAQEKVENNIINLEKIRAEMKDATRELKEAKEIYNSSWKCFLANHWLKVSCLLIIFFSGIYIITKGKKLETEIPNHLINKIEDLTTPKN
jgi:hypothetical protein